MFNNAEFKMKTVVAAVAPFRCRAGCVVIAVKYKTDAPKTDAPRTKAAAVQSVAFGNPD